MDYVLSSNPSSFRILRAFWKTSFIKIDNQENKALRDIILKRNEEHKNNQISTFPFVSNIHPYIGSTVSNKYAIRATNLMTLCSSGNIIKHEMAIKAGIIDILSRKEKSPFGNWDYVSRQVIA